MIESPTTDANITRRQRRLAGLCVNCAQPSKLYRCRKCKYVKARSGEPIHHAAGIVEAWQWPKISEECEV